MYVLVKSKFKDNKRPKDDTNTESTFSPEKWTFRDFSFFSPFKTKTLPIIGLHSLGGNLFEFSELVKRVACFNNIESY